MTLKAKPAYENLIQAATIALLHLNLKGWDGNPPRRKIHQIWTCDL